MAKKKEIVKILLKTYDYYLIDQAAKKIINSVIRTGAKIKGPIPLPTRREIFTVIRSPFVNKDSREQFGRFTHKRLIQIIEPNNQTIDALMHINLPSAVNIFLKK
ncbi:MAG: 30S ribosomal protein S10 [Candidatus Phytoplasma stylosanthis]|uniref:30S ribosomal protein S10 n=1 Tax=Candidatus Phytoplasma stylosanthis TaxID=2798314 RepID=UPI002939914B|nr:30S ribosomal protein S10 [Candidatus Phytoplasma stylosanthis]MDV3167837.1 30S ribosomal protein S10 [Candidatus Phytoplasma stylosanthis]MDV3170887.1 30S ribosomal protein S10 [Candidatus Phytoplasma stylosanthis]MDV3173699.1 30S ribosomal protein S10 [Candidatus Phytoplasma stylosanthis]MDV3174067.1 30S ribosomal protein S10 [Candidatus Phytoplasma stylosanthis]MDV3196144.1 30S ribosomal protein S10 [Candidatus Phytoplasma stylosanthis]